MKTGILLVNLGTPTAPSAPAVRAYLAEFLGDPRVVKLPRFLWLPILHGIILRTRPAKSAEKYAAVWTDEGSPLAVHTQRQAKLLRGLLGAGGAPIEYAMRYGEPRIRDGLQKLRDAGCTQITLLPLYPQYSESTTETIRDVVGKDAGVVDNFHDHPAYIAALAALVRRQWEHYGRGAKLLMSYHGLPQAVVDAGDPYQKQCMATSTLLAAALQLKAPDYVVTFQSRFGPAKWIQPYTEPTLEELARSGVREVDVVCPGFVSDCLETLEELGIGARAAFLGAGGNRFQLMPCLNESPEWIEAMRNIAFGAAGTR
ncbi:MAG: ferrochelatase [Betaproteobacteria bacterium]|nr:ferrochelatase [Betaproteobacteria bacterium]